MQFFLHFRLEIYLETYGYGIYSPVSILLTFSVRFFFQMDSIDKTCTPLKQQYDQCFNKWYSEKFLTGQWTQKDGAEPCIELFTQYKACVTKSLKEKNIELDEVMKRILGTEEEKKPPESN
eukprot:TCONS_00015472-protein